MMKSGKKVKELMNNPKADVKMTRKTHYVNQRSYTAFEKICKKNGHSTSSVVDAMIEDFISEHQG